MPGLDRIHRRSFNNRMKRFAGLFRETWWVWLAVCAVGTLLAFVVSPIFWVTYPISVFSFVYFGLVRYDESGNLRHR